METCSMLINSPAITNSISYNVSETFYLRGTPTHTWQVEGTEVGFMKRVMRQRLKKISK